MTIISIILINYRLLQYQFIVKYTLLSLLKSSPQKLPTLHNFQLYNLITFPYGRIIIRPYFLNLLNFPNSIPYTSNQPHPQNQQQNPHCFLRLLFHQKRQIPCSVFILRANISRLFTFYLITFNFRIAGCHFEWHRQGFLYFILSNLSSPNVIIEIRNI